MMPIFCFHYRFYLVSMPGQVKYPTQGKYVTGSGLTHSHWTINALQRAFSNV